MVATIPKSSSPTHDLAARLHRKVAKPTDVELKTALVLQDASHCGSFVVANITSIAETIGTTRTQVMRAIKRMRRVGLIGAEFTGVGERLIVIVAAKHDDHLIAQFMADLIDGGAGEGTAAA